MGKYVNNNLTRGEFVRYEATRHWLAYSVLIVVGILLLIGCINMCIEEQSAGPLFWVIIYELIIVFACKKAVESYEFVITNKRVILKNGNWKRKSFEQVLNKVDSIMIDESVFDRMLGTGTIIIRTAGATQSAQWIVNPTEFRNAFYEAVDDLEASM